MSFLNNSGLERLWAHILLKLNRKVDKIDGKSLSTNDFTNEDKEKLNSITQSDWAQTDETQLDFIKNKPDVATKDYVDSKALPEGAGVHQMLVTDANGEKVWEERTHYAERGSLVNIPLIDPNARFGDQTFPDAWAVTQTNMAAWDMTANIADVACEGVVIDDLYNLVGCVVSIYRNGTIEKNRIEENHIFDDGEYLQVGGSSGGVKVTSEGKITLSIEGSPNTWRPSAFPVELFVEDVRTIDPKYLPNPIPAEHLPEGVAFVFNVVFYADSEYQDGNDFIYQGVECIKTIEEIENALNAGAVMKGALVDDSGNHYNLPTMCFANGLLQFSAMSAAVTFADDGRPAGFDSPVHMIVAGVSLDGSNLAFARRIALARDIPTIE